MNQIAEELSKIGIVPVIVIEDASKAEALAGALMEGGIACAEVTYRTAAAAEAIQRMHKAYPSMLLGAGTVLNKEQAKEAMQMGASFIVSPGFNPDTVQFCLDNEYPVIPGVMTPTEIEMAISKGLDTVKFFPAEAAGGIKMLKAMCAPYKRMHFMPTGGINLSNIKDYLDFKPVFACGGSWIATGKDIEAEDYAGITKKCREVVELLKNR